MTKKIGSFLKLTDAKKYCYSSVAIPGIKTYC